MTTLVRLIGALFLSAVALVGATGCGGETTSGVSSATSSEPSETATEEGGQPDDGAAPAGGVVFVDASAGPASEIVTITKAGFDPQEVTVAVGDVVKFTAPDTGVFGVIVADLEGKTVTKGLDEYFRFDEPGTYPVKEDVSGATAAVTVK